MPSGRARRCLSMLRMVIMLITAVLAGSACAATVGPSRIPEAAAPARRDLPDPGPTLQQRTIELPAEALKNANCTAEDWRRIRSLRNKAFISFYVVGPVVSLSRADGLQLACTFPR